MPDIGATLKEARERNGLSIAACAERTRIRSKYLTALEENRFGALPELAYARGFLRTYAESLGVEPARLLAEYDVQMAATRREPGSGAPLQLEAREPRRSQGTMSNERGRRPARLVWLGIGLVVAVALVFWVARAAGSEPPPNGSASAYFSR